MNVGWGLANLAVAYLLLVRVGEFDLRSPANITVSFSGLGLMALFIARSIRRIRKAGA